MNHRHERALLCTAILAALLAGSAYAQDATTNKPAASKKSDEAPVALDSITVTATKREQDVQKVPISMAAYTGEQLERQGITSLSDLSRIAPALSVASSGPGANNLIVRGISSSAGSAATVGYYLDDVPIAASSNAALISTRGGIEPYGCDIQRVEGLGRGLMTQSLPNGLTGVADRLNQTEHFGNTLHRERHQGITCAVIAAIVAINGDAQLLRRNVGQRGNVVSHFAPADQGTHFVKDLVQQRLHEWVRHESPSAAGVRSLDEASAGEVTPVQRDDDQFRGRGVANAEVRGPFMFVRCHTMIEIDGPPEGGL